MKENAHDMFFGSWYNLEDGSGVYAIVNSLDNKKYIGSTGTLRKRFRQHYSALIKGERVNCYLQRAVNKFGIDKFYFIVLGCYQGKQKSAYGYIWKLKNTQNDR